LNAALRAIGTRAAKHKSAFCLLGLLGLLVALYWPAATMQQVFYVGDIYRLGYPARVEYAQALRDGRMPLWTAGALGGYPVLAEGQTGAFYPLNLLLYRFLPVPVAMNCSILVSFWLAGVGTFLYIRSLQMGRLPAFLAAATVMLGGFLPGHLDHLNMLAAASWLPWVLWAVETATARPTAARWALVGLFFGLQGLAGHPQVSLLTALPALAQAALGPLGEPSRRLSLRTMARQVALGTAALAGGAALAAVQWLPTYELTRLSERGHGLDLEFFTSFSLHPAHYATMLWPFLRGNPYPLTSLETIGYAGALPLMLAVAAPLRRRDRLVLFWMCVCLVAVLLSLGRWNPAYRWLRHVPVLSYFRAPARYLAWLDVGVAVLAAASVETLLRLTRRSGGRPQAWAAAGVAVALGLGAWWVSRLPLERLLEAWRFLPAAWLSGGALVLTAARWRPSRAVWSSLAVGLLVMDLFAFNGVYNQTYNAVMPRADLERPPEVLAFLHEDAGQERYRVFTSEEIVPVLPVMRESLYPNIQLLHGVESLNGYYPLLPGPQRWLIGNLNARLADLLGVRYVLVPQLLPVDEASEAYDTHNPLAPSLTGRTFEISPLRVVAVEVEGNLSHSADLTDGTPVGDVVLRAADGSETVWTLKAGDDLGEWAYLRDDVAEVVRHRLPARIARRWPARSGFPPRDHEGLTFLAHRELGDLVEVVQVEVRARVPAAFLYLERLRLIDPGGRSWLLSDLVNEGDHVLVYRSEDVAVFRNEGAGPRAFLVHRARVAADEAEAQRLVLEGNFSLRDEVVLLEGPALQGAPVPGDEVAIETYRPERVRVRVHTEAEGYLVLADSFYPGWEARLDGREAELLRANVVLRAVRVPPGDHLVEFTYSPLSWRLGLAVSAVAWLGLAVILVAGLWKIVVHRQ
jgi:hypothetical protein